MLGASIYLLILITCRDFDPAENFKDKLSHFGEVSGYRGLGKLLKEIAVSSNVLSKPEPSPHDFVGLLNVPLKVSQQVSPLN